MIYPSSPAQGYPAHGSRHKVPLPFAQGIPHKVPLTMSHRSGGSHRSWHKVPVAFAQGIPHEVPLPRSHWPTLTPSWLCCAIPGPDGAPALRYVFGGIFESTQECTYEGCRRLSTKLDPMSGIQVSYPVGPHATLEAALVQYQRAAPMRLSPCPACRKDLRKQKFTVDTWPYCLVIQLKRWRKGSTGRWNFKDARPIGFREQMDQGGHPYQLRAVICHSGSAGSGHYISNIKVAGQWWRCDDTLVSSTDWTAVQKSEAYMFFYER